MPDIGPTLRDARLRAKIDMNEVERVTKIRTKYLRALEDEDWDLLPGPTFVKSFLRTYGDYLGLDSRMLVDEFRMRYERPSDAELAPLRAGSQPRERHGRARPRWLSRAFVAALFIALIAALVALGEWKGGNGPSGPAGDASGAGGAAARHHARRHGTPGAHRRAARRVRLRIVPTGTVYVCLVDGKGHKLIAGRTLRAGQSLPTYRAKRLKITLGNAEVRMTVDGRRVSVAHSSQPTGYAFGPGGQRRLPSSQQPTCG